MAEVQKYPKRLIEVDLPIREISAHASREKSIRHGHISTLHIWWARRPLGACRAVLCASLWPDPMDPECPTSFRQEAVRAVCDFAEQVRTDKNVAVLCQAHWDNWNRIAREISSFQTTTDWKALRGALLDFIADYANWDASSNSQMTAMCQRLTAACTSRGDRPVVFDPFCGGGSIPLEAMRVGAVAHASDLNPLPVLLNKALLEWFPKYGVRLAEEFRIRARELGALAFKDLKEYYPIDKDGSVPIAYLWARTVRCEGPGCGVEIPLIRSPVLATKGKKSVFLEIRWERGGNQILCSPVSGHKSPDGGTVRRGAALCPACGYTTPPANVRAQFANRRGGTSDARLLCVVTMKDGAKSYRPATERDERAVSRARNVLSSGDPSAVALPSEPLPYLRSIFNIKLLGVETWGDLYAPRQALHLRTFTQKLRDIEPSLYPDDSAFRTAIVTLLAFAIDKMADFHSSLCRWISVGEKLGNTFGRQALGTIWDYAEANPFANVSGSWERCCGYIAEVIETAAVQDGHGQSLSASATALPYPSDSAGLVFTDPPYYDLVPYADLSDYFYVWLKQSVGHLFPGLFSGILAPKKEEIVQLAERNKMYGYKTRENYERLMASAMDECRRVVTPDGLGVVVFAHKGTGAWEAQLQAMIDAGWTIVASWPIDTERQGRLRALRSATLTSSIHLVCRPRENADGSLRTDSVGSWRAVLSALPIRIHDWMPRLAAEGVVGADAIFACLGPALEIYSQYSHVEKASGDRVGLKEYLEEVWAAVAREALSMMFEGADASGLEEDARLTAMWLWTLGAGTTNELGDQSHEEDESDDDDEGKGKLAGFVLEYDAARKIAQGLGAHLDKLPDVVEVKGDKARLLAVSERAKHLFGKEESTPDAPKRKKAKESKKQLGLFAEIEAAEKQGLLGAGGVPKVGETTLDKVHQSMILFGAGRSEALKRFIVEEGVGKDGRFWKLAQSLSALYPSGSEEKRWVDGVLARKKGLGFG